MIKVIFSLEFCLEGKEAIDQRFRLGLPAGWGDGYQFEYRNKPVSLVGLRKRNDWNHPVQSFSISDQMALEFEAFVSKSEAKFVLLPEDVPFLNSGDVAVFEPEHDKRGLKADAGDVFGRVFLIPVLPEDRVIALMRVVVARQHKKELAKLNEKIRQLEDAARNYEVEIGQLRSLHSGMIARMQREIANAINVLLLSRRQTKLRTLAELRRRLEGETTLW